MNHKMVHDLFLIWSIVLPVGLVVYAMIYWRLYRCEGTLAG